MLLTIIITLVMIRIITSVMIITKYSLLTVNFATRYSTRYSDFLLQPYSKSKKATRRCLLSTDQDDTEQMEEQLENDDRIFKIERDFLSKGIPRGWTEGTPMCSFWDCTKSPTTDQPSAYCLTIYHIVALTLIVAILPSN